MKGMKYKRLKKVYLSQSAMITDTNASAQLQLCSRHAAPHNTQRTLANVGIRSGVGEPAVGSRTSPRASERVGDGRVGSATNHIAISAGRGDRVGRVAS